MGDGGHCALPSPPIVVQGGEMRQSADDVADLRARTIASLWITTAKAAGVDGVREVVEQSTRDRPDVAPVVVLPCSCGHVLTARDRGPGSVT
jgi:hypothetical protein